MRGGHVLGLVAVALAFCVVYGPALDLFFTADDFVLLQYAKDTSAGEIVRTRLLAGPRSDLTSPYWRPGWLLLFDAAYETFGLAPRGFRGVVFALHAVMGVLVYAVARRWLVCPRGLAVAACACFALSPAYFDALVWISAGLNVLPAAVCLFAAGAAYARHVERRSPRLLVTAWALGLVSFAFREAGYHLPLVAFFAHVCLGPGTLPRRVGRGVLGALPFGVVVLVHNRFLNPFEVGHMSLGENVRLALRHGEQWLHLLFGLPDSHLATAACLVALVAAAVHLPARGRFCLAWAAAASFPFVARSHDTRFLYFTHAPLALAVAAFAWRLSGSRPRAPLATSALLGLAALQALRVAPALEQARARSQTTRGVVELVHTGALAEHETLHVDFVPPELVEGLPELIALHGGGRPRVVNHWVVRRPPFLIHVNPGFAELEADQEMLHWDEASRRFLPCRKRDVVGELQPVPMFSFRHRVQVVDDWAAVRFAPDTVHLQQPVEPPLAPGEGRDEVFGYAGGTLSRIDLGVHAPRDAMLVIAFLTDLRQVGGRAFVDGQEVPLLLADGVFNAIPVRAGSREVVLKTDL